MLSMKVNHAAVHYAAMKVNCEVKQKTKEEAAQTKRDASAQAKADAAQAKADAAQAKADAAQAKKDEKNANIALKREKKQAEKRLKEVVLEVPGTFECHTRANMYLNFADFYFELPSYTSPNFPTLQFPPTLNLTTPPNSKSTNFPQF